MQVGSKHWDCKCDSKCSDCHFYLKCCCCPGPKGTRGKEDERGKRDKLK